VLLTGVSGYGLAAADGVTRGLEQRGLGRPTPIGVVPLVPTAVVFDPSAGEPGARPGPDQGYAACEAARPGIPERGRVGAGAGAAVGKMLGREHATLGGVGYAALKLAANVTVAAIAVANAFGDVLAGAHGENGELTRSADLIAQTPRSLTGCASRPEHDPCVRVHRRVARQAQLRDRRASSERRDRKSDRPGLYS
jgi:L-aminopeptidase/D-esterase-like protein